MSIAAIFPSFNLQNINLQSFDLQSSAQVFSSRMFNSVAEGIGIALLGWVLLHALGRQNSGTRFAVWFSALLGIAALPMFGHFGSSEARIPVHSQITLPASWALYIFFAWLVIATASLVRIGVGFFRLRTLRKSCQPIDRALLDPLPTKTLEELASVRGVTVCRSDNLHVPTAIGFIKPLVVIPSWTMRELSAVELNAILLHELAHLRRWDDWTNLAQKILGALLFFHPAVWWIEKKLALEREMACDDLALSRSSNPRAYAECLVSVAEKSLVRRGFSLAQAAIGRVRHMSLRVTQILDEKRPAATRVWRPAPLMLTGVTLASLIAFSDAPRLVSFRDAASPTVSASAVMPIRSVIDSSSHMGARAVPANFAVKTETGHPPFDAEINQKPKQINARVVPATSKKQDANPPALLRAAFPDEGPSRQTLILVLQTVQSDRAGSVVWNLCVWQVTVLGPAQAEPGTVAKSI